MKKPKRHALAAINKSHKKLLQALQHCDKVLLSATPYMRRTKAEGNQ